MESTDSNNVVIQKCVMSEYTCMAMILYYLCNLFYSVVFEQVGNQINPAEKEEVGDQINSVEEEEVGGQINPAEKEEVGDQINPVQVQKSAVTG